VNDNLNHGDHKLKLIIYYCRTHIHTVRLGDTDNS